MLLSRKTLQSALAITERMETTADVSDLVSDQARPAAVLVPLVERQIETDLFGYHLLLTRRAAHLKHHAGQISFPGGRKEQSDPNLQHTALRETFEEIGITPNQVDIIGQLPQHETITDFIMTPFVGIIQDNYKITMDAAEVAECFEVPLSFVLDVNNHKLKSAFFQGQERYYYSMQYLKYDIWGATARVLVEFAKRIQQHM